MTLLQTVLSVLVTWAFLTVLIVGLLLILKALASVRGHLERIAVGVRAIERQLDPLEDTIEGAAPRLESSTGALERLAERMDAAAAAARRADLEYTR